MRKVFAAVFIVLVLASPCFSAGEVWEQNIAVTSGVTKIMDIPNDVQNVLLQVTNGGAVRMTFGGYTVTSTKGLYVPLYGTYEARLRGEAAAIQITADSGNTGSGASVYAVGYYKDR